MMKAIRFGAVAAVALLAACSRSAEEPAPAQETPVAETPAPPPGLVLDNSQGEGATLVYAEGTTDPAFDPECVIDNGGVAGISMPETLGEFISAFPESTALSFYPNYMVDFGSLCARAGGEDAICAYFESYDVERYDPGIPVIGMAAYAPQCRTREGVGPGTTIERAVESYGPAKFDFNYGNEGREYVAFDHAPQNLNFRASAPVEEDPGGTTPIPNGDHAGNYTGVEADDGGMYETSKAAPHAKIWEVWVSPTR